MANAFEKLFNSLNDTDWLWWPVLKWRPALNEVFSNRLVFKVLIVAAVIVLPLLALIIHALYGQLDPASFGIAAFSGLLAAYLFLKFGFAAAWNRRTKRLRS